MKFPRFLLPLTYALVPLLLSPLQAGSPPSQLWSSMGISRTSARGIKTELEQQLRSRIETPIFKETFYELRLSYPLQPSLDLILFYRQVFYADNTAWRLAAAPQLKAPFGLEGLMLRLMIQRHAPNGEAASYHARLRGTLALPFKRRPSATYVQAEPWWALEDPVTLSRYRLDAGFQLSPSGGLSYGVYYRFQGDRGNLWQGTHILGLRLQATL